MRLKAHDPRSKHIKLDAPVTEHGSARPGSDDAENHDVER
jgi:hypothetical protein